MSFLSLHYVPRSIKDDSEWEKYAMRTKPLRLRSLKEDARSFVSKYEVEVNEPPAFWVKRLKDPVAWTIVMVESSEELAVGDAALLREDIKYVAFCVMIDPRGGHETTGIAGEGEAQPEEHPEWHMAAVWLDPDLRGQGAGRRLVEYGLEVARQADHRNGISGRSCNTQVVHGNDGALQVYRNIGFEVVNVDSTIEKDGHVHHATELKIAL